jgi:hypothetical protein
MICVYVIKNGMNNEGYQRQVETSLPGCEQVALDGCVTGMTSGYKETCFRREKLLCLYAMRLIFFHNFIIACPDFNPQQVVGVVAIADKSITDKRAWQGLVFPYNVCWRCTKLVVKVRRDSGLSLSERCSPPRGQGQAAVPTEGKAGLTRLIPVSAAATHDAQDE